jgi:SET domain
MPWDDRLTYLFALSDGTLIDGAQGGNATRHLNHACEPNCEAVEDHDEDGRLTVRIETTKSIRANDELFLDYALDIGRARRPVRLPVSLRIGALPGDIGGVGRVVSRCVREVRDPRDAELDDQAFSSRSTSHPSGVDDMRIAQSDA